MFFLPWNFDAKPDRWAFIRGYFARRIAEIYPHRPNSAISGFAYDSGVALWKSNRIRLKVVISQFGFMYLKAFCWVNQGIGRKLTERLMQHCESTPLHPEYPVRERIRIIYLSLDILWTCVYMCIWMNGISSVQVVIENLHASQGLTTPPPMLIAPGQQRGILGKGTPPISIDVQAGASSPESLKATVSPPSSCGIGLAIATERHAMKIRWNCIW